MKYLIIIACTAMALSGQRLDLSSLDKFANRAAESANVDLDGDKLKLASQFLGGDEKSTGQARSIVESLKGVFVRQYEFDKPGEYSPADLEAVRSQLKSPGWSSIVSVKERTESVDVYVFNQNGQFGGLAVIAAEPKELAVVNIVGPLDLASLMKIAGSMGGVGLDLGALGGPKAKPQPQPKPAKDDDNDENID